MNMTEGTRSTACKNQKVITTFLYSPKNTTIPYLKNVLIQMVEVVFIRNYLSRGQGQVPGDHDHGVEEGQALA